MSKFRVSFYKTLRHASGHSSRHLLRQLDLTSDSPSGALVAAERLIDPREWETDCVEVVNISPASHGHANAASG
jgi:hypothetical protein